MRATTPAVRAARVSNHWPLVSGIVAVVLAVLLGAFIAARKNLPLAIDTAWMNEILEHRGPGWEVPALVMNFLGGGWFGVAVVPALTVFALVLARRRNAAYYYVIAALASVGLVQLLKSVIERARPTDMLVVSDPGSFPSGHVANAATIAVALALIFRRVWIWAVGFAYVATMALSRTYLGVHWLSDTVGGALLGVGIAVIVWAPFAYRLDQERSVRKRTGSVAPEL